jgi:hypothetical protein
MKLRKTDKWYKTGMFCIVLAFALAAIISFSIEVGIIAEDHRLTEFLAGIVTVVLLIFVWNGFRLWFYFLEKVRLRYNSFTVILYVGCHVVAGYWAYRKLRKYEQTTENI